MRPSNPDNTVGDGGDDGPRARERRLKSREIVHALLGRWETGEVTDDEEVVAVHRHLLPEIEQELRSARLVRGAGTVARDRSPGPATTPRFHVPTDEELYAPLDGDEGHGAPTSPPRERGPLRIRGFVGLAKVSEGGQATVYRAVQESTGRAVAIKVMQEASADDSRQRARFRREAEALAVLRHPNVVDILDRGRTDDGRHYIAMEFVEGADFDEWCDALPNSVAGTRRLLEAFVTVCRAVQEAHARGIVHRDLKPSNVRIDVRGNPRVLDFGLARSGDRSAGRHRNVTTSGQLVGSIPWASPEQAAGDSDNLDARSDVYSLGVMLYRATSGEPPYDTNGPLYESLSNIARARPPRPTSRPSCRRLPVRTRWLDAVVLRALAKSPALRYGSAGALADDLDRLLRGRRVHACPPPLTAGSVARRTAAALTLAASVVLTGWWTLRPPSPPPVFPLLRQTNSVEMQFVRIPPGRASTGSPLDEPGRRGNEGRASVDLREFWIGTTEVTQAQYARVTGRPAPNQTREGDDVPVHGISWDDAVEFCRLLSLRDGRTYRLPREDEWEYACRAGSRGPFFAEGGINRVGWAAVNSGGLVQPVARKWPNSWGLYDTHGNVQEWCERPRPAPFDPPTNVNAGDHRILRGGAADRSADDCRAASRLSRPRTQRPPTAGFRVLMEVNE